MRLAVGSVLMMLVIPAVGPCQRRGSLTECSEDHPHGAVPGAVATLLLCPVLRWAVDPGARLHC